METGDKKRVAERMTLGLAQFLRVKSEQDAEVFERQWPGYFPASFWTWRIPQVPPSVALLRQPQLHDLEFWRAYQNVLLEAWREKFPLEEAVRLLVAPVAQRVDALSALPVHDFQGAVLLLALEPWRAKWCIGCGQPFAAEKPASKFCSTKCFGNARRAAKQQWWKENRSNGKSSRRSRR